MITSRKNRCPAQVCIEYIALRIIGKKGNEFYGALGNYSYPHLHAAIQEAVEDDLDLTADRDWPRTGRTLWKKIREVTPLLETHGIRAARSASKKMNKPIVLDTDFNGGDTGGDKSQGAIRGAIISAHRPPTIPIPTPKGAIMALGGDIFGILSGPTPRTPKKNIDNTRVTRIYRPHRPLTAQRHRKIAYTVPLKGAGSAAKTAQRRSMRAMKLVLIRRKVVRRMTR